MHIQNDTDLLAFSSILGGLLASGHYTKKRGIDEHGNAHKALLIWRDCGPDWQRRQEDRTIITSRYIPSVCWDAYELFRVVKNSRFGVGDADHPAGEMVMVVPMTDVIPQQMICAEGFSEALGDMWTWGTNHKSLIAVRAFEEGFFSIDISGWYLTAEVEREIRAKLGAMPDSAYIDLEN
jgi:hypothetical protein